MKKIAILACIVMLSAIGFMTDLGMEPGRSILQAADVKVQTEQFEPLSFFISEAIEIHWQI